jgi:GWxTD domain-containing protein
MGSVSSRGGAFLSAAAAVLLLAGIMTTAGCGVSMMPTKDTWYTQHYYIMQVFERDIYRHLSDTAKAEYQAYFWQARRPEAKQLFDKRMEFVMKTYAKENRNQPWNTDRGRVFLLNGSPASIDYKQNTEWAGGVREGGGITGATERVGEDVQAMMNEVWTYQHAGQTIYYTFSFVVPNEWRMQIRMDQNRFLGELEQYNRSVVFGPMNPEEYRNKVESLRDVK